jgi:hypothetical protein
MDIIQTFIELIKAASYKDKPFGGQLVPLTNISFFLGAGFSKSWDKNYPTGTELFSFDVKAYSDELYEFIDNIGYSGVGRFDLSKFKDMAYQLSMQRKYPSIRSRYIDLYNINIIENVINAGITKRFKDLATINYVKESNEKLKLTKAPSKDQLNIVKFFRWLNDQSTGDTDGIPEGLRPHFITTNYDFLIESILDVILEPDDSHLLYTYRGFTPGKTNGVKTPRTVFKHWLVQSLIKINGGFEIYKDNNGFSVDYREKTDDELKMNAPVLIVPNREQDYTGAYFQTIFPKAIRILQESKVLIIVGYSLPEEDALLRLLLRQFAEENVDGTEKVIFNINPMPENEQINKLESVFPYHAFARHRYNIFTYTGYFNDWVNSIMARI